MSDLALSSPPAAAGADHAATAAARIWQWRRTSVTADPRAAAAAARRKGVLGGLIGLSVAAVIYFFWKPGMAVVVATIALATTLLALLSPLGGFRRFSHALEVFARGVGLAVTWLLMTLAYWLLFVPVGLLLRARHRLRITRGADPRRATYWDEARAAPPTLDSYRRSF